MKQGTYLFHTFFVISIFIMFACENSTDDIDFDEIGINDSETEETDLQYLALGDSYTIGQECLRANAGQCN